MWYVLKRLVIMTGLLIYGGSISAENRPAIKVGEDFEVSLLNGEVGILATCDTLHIEQVRSLPDTLFVNNKFTNFLFSLTQKEHWLTYTLVNTGGEEKELLLEIVNPNLKKIRHYQFLDGQMIRKDSIGTHSLFHQRPILHQNFLLPIRISPGDTIKCYLALSPIPQSLNFNLFCWDRDIRINKQGNRETIWLVAFFQLNFIFFILVLVASIIFKARSLWYYTVYVLLGSCLVFSDLGLGFRYLWSNLPRWQFQASFLLVNLYFICGTQFIRHFFKTARRHPFFDRIFLIAIAITIAIVTFTVFISDLPLSFAHLLMGGHYVLVLLCLVCFLMMFLKDLPERKHYKTAWFLVAYALHGLGIIVTLLQYAGFIRAYSMTQWLQALDLPITFYTQILLMIGMVLEVPIVIYIAYQDFNGLLRRSQRQAKRLAQMREDNVKALVVGVETERRRLATDLHDGLSVNLAAIKLKANLMEIQAPAPQKTNWREIMQDIEMIYDELRYIVHNLPPRSLFRVGLQGALDEIIQRTRRLQPQLNVFYQYHLPAQRPEPEAEAHLYRIVLELLNNVLKHAQADELSIQLTAFAGEQVIITVEDNGRGFKPGMLLAKGMGLSNIRQRAHLLDGDLVIDSHEGKGTTMVVTLSYGKVFTRKS